MRLPDSWFTPRRSAQLRGLALAARLAAPGFAAVALIRATDRLYHLAHPELNLQNDAPVPAVWTVALNHSRFFAARSKPLPVV